jgi:hypothetical protein
LIYHTAAINGYTFDPEVYSGGGTPLTQRGENNDNPRHDADTLTPLPDNFHWKKLRDRIRCYYKAHVQNSKKRLATMLNNPIKTRNRIALARAFDIIQNELDLDIDWTDNQTVLKSENVVVHNAINEPENSTINNESEQKKSIVETVNKIQERNATVAAAYFEDVSVAAAEKASAGTESRLSDAETAANTER